jgi:hypothetical protein
VQGVGVGARVGKMSLAGGARRLVIEGGKVPGRAEAGSDF